MPLWLITFFSKWGLQSLRPLLLILVIAGGAYFVHKSAYDKGYSFGYAKALKDNPPNVYNGPTTVNQQPCEQARVFGIDLGKWGFGLVHKK